MTTRQELLLRAADLGWPQVMAGGTVISTESGWHRAVDVPGHLAALDTQLTEAEGAATQRREFEASMADHDRHRAAQSAPFTAEEEAERQAQLDEARELAEYAASTPGKLDVLIGLTRDVLAALQRR